MQISFNTYKPYAYTNKLNNTQQSKQPSFKSGYGAEEIEPIDSSDLMPRSNSERWKNIAKGIKMLTVDQYKRPPKEKPIVFTPEECEKFRQEFYKGTDLEGQDITEILGKKDQPVEESPINNDDDYYEDEFDF